MLAGFFRVVPRAGPFKAMAFKKQTPETEKLYMAGFNASIDRYRQLLAGVSSGGLYLFTGLRGLNVLWLRHQPELKIGTTADCCC